MIRRIRCFMRNNFIIKRTIYPFTWYFMNKVLRWRSRLLRVYGLEILLKVQEAAKNENVECSPYFGSLLGLLREGRLIKHDVDIDFLIGPDVKNVKSLYNRLKSIGFVPDRILLLNDKILEFSMSYKIVGVDFFLVGHNSSRDRNIFVFDDRGEVRLHTYPKITGMVGINTVSGKTIMVPENSIEHLDNEYGTWRTPNKNWDARRGPSFYGLLDRSKVSVKWIRDLAQIDMFFETHSDFERIDGEQLEKYLITRK